VLPKEAFSGLPLALISLTPPAGLMPPPRRTPSDLPKVSEASTIRASIRTWRTGMSSLAISCCTCSSGWRCR
jgi:hypothetical protein